MAFSLSRLSIIFWPRSYTVSISVVFSKLSRLGRDARPSTGGRLDLDDFALDHLRLLLDPDADGFAERLRQRLRLAHLHGEDLRARHHRERRLFAERLRHAHRDTPSSAGAGRRARRRWRLEALADHGQDDTDTVTRYRFLSSNGTEVDRTRSGRSERRRRGRRRDERRAAATAGQGLLRERKEKARDILTDPASAIDGARATAPTVFRSLRARSAASPRARADAPGEPNRGRERRRVVAIDGVETQIEHAHAGEEVRVLADHPRDTFLASKASSSLDLGCASARRCARCASGP